MGCCWAKNRHHTSDAGQPIYGLLVAYPEAGLPLLQ
jgi:hypothetical protein